MDPTLLDFLRRFKTDSLYTHTSQDPPGKYYIPENDKDFWGLYLKTAKNRNYINLLENPNSEGPLRVDIDFRYNPEDATERLYNFEYIKALVGFYQSEIKKIVATGLEDDTLFRCVVLEKRKPRYVDGLMKDGLHLHFPFLICDTWVFKLLRGRVIELLRKCPLWNKLPLSEDMDKVIDRNMATKTWHMYGSSKSSRQEPYLATHFLSHTFEELDIEVFFNDFSKNCLETYLGVLMSIRSPEMKITPLQDSIESFKSMMKKNKKRRKVLPPANTNALENIQILKSGNFLDMISSDRANDRNLWIDVGWTLYCVGNGCEEALNFWIEFSKKAPGKFQEGICENEWSKMEFRGKNMNSMYFMARQDSPELFRQWKEHNINYQIQQSLAHDKPNDLDVAEVVKTILGSIVICTTPSKNIWYYFDDHKWNESLDGIFVKNFIIYKLCHRYNLFKLTVATQIANGEGKIDELQKHDKKLYTLTRSLGKVGTVNKITDMCKILLADKKGAFIEHKDQNSKLFVCSNGVLDLEMLAFREGRPDDYMTMSSKVIFKEFDEKDEEITQVEEFLEKIFPNPNLRNYFLDIAASCLEGGNIYKVFVCHTGVGNNGKTIIFKLLEKTFQEYFIKFPRGLFVEGTVRSASGPKPELVRSKGTKIAGLQELTDREKIHKGHLKEMTGNDSIFCRNLHERGGEITPTFTLMMQANRLPKIPDNDEAVWNRIRVLEYESVFNNQAPEDEKEQFEQKHFKPDLNLADKLKDFTSSFLWLIFNRYKYIKTHGFHEPQEVLRATNKYKHENDVIYQFMKASIRKNPEDSISVKLLFSFFKEWFRANYSGKCDIGRARLQMDMSARVGVDLTKETELFGYSLVTE